MSVSALPERRNALPLAAALVASLLGFYLLALDQGHALALVHGASAFEQNLVHEFLHDARHAAGFPCH